MFALSEPWEFTLHAEVWLLIAGVMAIGWFATKVIQPKAIRAGYAPITRSQKRWYVAAVVTMWISSDWPMHDIAERYLYSVHMVQHLLLAMIIPAMFVLATPHWLIELVVGPNPRLWEGLRRLVHPLTGIIVFNATTALLHWSVLVKLSVENGGLHFALHLLVFLAGLTMWMPVIGPIEEWHLGPIGKLLYLFSMTIVPTVPGGWLVFAEDVVYPSYDTAFRAFGLSALADQQLAGAIMKLVGGFFLWVVIAILWFRYAGQAEEEARLARQARFAERTAHLRVENAVPETVDEVLESFETSPPAPEPGAPD